MLVSNQYHPEQESYQYGLNSTAIWSFLISSMVSLGTVYFIMLKYGWDYWNEPRSQKELEFIKSIRPQVIVLVGIGICLVGTIVALVLLGEAM